jgi:hypothetical protein
MSLTTAESTWGYTNVTPGATLTLTALGLKSNYASVMDEANEVVRVNKTTPIDQTEVVSIRSSVVPKVNVSKYLPVPNPSPIKTGITYTVQTEVLLRHTDDQGNVTDFPIVAYTHIRHQRSGVISSALVEEAFNRHVSAFFHDDGTSRFNELMRSALQPEAD